MICRLLACSQLHTHTIELKMLTFATQNVVLEISSQASCMSLLESQNFRPTLDLGNYEQPFSQMAVYITVLDILLGTVSVFCLVPVPDSPWFHLSACSSPNSHLHGDCLTVASQYDAEQRRKSQLFLVLDRAVLLHKF